MGIPKYFRWLSERYPAISQLIAENRIPEFDCLYLDMNGIIHNCTHSDSDSPTFRMTEDKMFIAIFNYIEHLYGKIKPKQLFFMAIDGVAPRAKMNQQRARRFRTALDAEMAKEKAIKEGVQMPTEDAFDSNCITPGTAFMAKLTQQLKYFISKKISEDADWQGVDIILSGHEVPGEGEHKIMEYIRLAKAQSDYDSNVRHCLYGLDADLIMLGLLSHDPHFCLLREEVTFGRRNQKKSKELEHQNFYLMHLCIVREYLELEFEELKDPAALNFAFDMERVIDDFILMAFFVGNDFLPNLPNLHINEGAVALMFKVYKSVLPKAGGYINKRGVINLERLGLLLDELAHIEYRFFEAENADSSWFKGKQMAKEDVMEKGKKKGQLSLSTYQKQLFQQVKSFINNRAIGPVNQGSSLDLPSTLNAADRKFCQELAEDLGLQWKSILGDNEERHLQLTLPEKLQGDEDDDEEDEEAQIALSRVMKRYNNAGVVDVTVEQARDEMDKKYQQKFLGWKNKYYRSKFDWGLENEEELRKLTENYVQGLQWVLYYYYRGVVSWPWFYAYHYSPMISDVKRGLGANMSFQLGQPFRPYQQLMGVLPDRSKRIVPTPYHDLMTNPDSPIIDFYPRDFELDMNGKRMEWEAVVKIPFIDERRLLKAMESKNHLLSTEEASRNEFGVTLKFTYSAGVEYTYPSSLAGILPDIQRCHCIENIFDLPTIEGIELHVGLVDGVKLGAAALAGFPSLKTLPHIGNLGFHSVSVFQQDSRNESMVITLLDADKNTKVQSAKAKLGRRVHVGYPFLSEAKVVRVSDELFSYSLPPSGTGSPIVAPHGPSELGIWHRKAEQIESSYSKRLGMIIGQVECLVHVDMLKGLEKTDDGATVKEFAHVPGIEVDYASQTVVDEVVSEDQRFLESAALPIRQEFPEGLRCFFLGEYNYGRPLIIENHIGGKAEVSLLAANGKEDEFGARIVSDAESNSPYTPTYAVAKMLQLNPLVLSKITSSFQVMLDDSRVNLGLNLKFEAKKLKVLGYTRRDVRGWELSQKAVTLIQQYMIQFPDFIAGIQRNPQGNIYNATDFYPQAEAKAKIKEIQAWLKSVQSKNFETVPLEAEQLDSETVLKIEEAANAAVAAAPKPKRLKVSNVPRNALLRPSDAEHRLGRQKFALGDRIVYVQDSGRVPIASRGTVVGKTRSARSAFLDVVFDVSFLGGSTLDGRCSEFRGSTLLANSVLNLSNHQVIAGSRAAESRRPQVQRQAFSTNGYGAPLGPNGQGQLVPAPAPAPLRGSFRGVASRPPYEARTGGTSPGRGGVVSDETRDTKPQNIPVRTQVPAEGNGSSVAQTNGFRGRGSHSNGMTRPDRAGFNSSQTTRGGYTRIDRGDPEEGVVRNSPNFRPQPYSNVPPPPSLDFRGHGRGRGRLSRGGAPHSHLVRGKAMLE